MSQTIWLARHANRLDFVHPEWFNTAPRRYDPPLSEDGLLQAEKLAQRLQTESIKHIFVSPFLRTIQTAYPLAEKLALPLKLDTGLGEWHNPDWMTEKPETHPRKELESLYPLIDWNYRSPLIPQYPENLPQLEQRTKKTIENILANFHNNLLIVSHSNSVLGIAQALLGSEVIINTPLCSLSKIVRSSTKTDLVLNGDTSHL